MSKLCCLVNTFLKCGECSKSWCRECQGKSNSHDFHEPGSINPYGRDGAICPLTRNRVYLSYEGGSFSPIYLRKKT